MRRPIHTGTQVGNVVASEEIGIFYLFWSDHCIRCYGHYKDLLEMSSAKLFAWSPVEQKQRK